MRTGNICHSGRDKDPRSHALPRDVREDVSVRKRERDYAPLVSTRGLRTEDGQVSLPLIKAIGGS